MEKYIDMEEPSHTAVANSYRIVNESENEYVWVGGSSGRGMT